jgi:hypothetical protein
MPTPVGDAGLSKLELWEYGRRKLGYGNWTIEHPDPYLKWAGLEAHKLFLTMRKRRVSQREFILCVDYCWRHKMRIENAVWVLKHYDDARHEQAERAQSEGLPQLIEQALAYEHSLAAADSPDWIAKLSRAAGRYREEVLDEWRLARNQPSPMTQAN